MTAFAYHDGALHAENLSLPELAERFGTPLYVYSRAALEGAYAGFADALAGQDALVCYAVKANPNLAILNLFARLGAGFDIVSGGELARVLAAGGDPARVVFSGVGKSEAEMRAALRAGIYCFNVESRSELDRLNRIAGELGQRAPVSLRVNPDVDAQTHPYISTGLKVNKFGVAFDEAVGLYETAAGLPGVVIRGVDCHIGSQLTDTAPFLAALERVLGLVDALAGRGVALTHLDLGGGLGIRYRDETPPPVADYVAAIRRGIAGRGLKLLLEPGRALVGNAGLLVARVEYLKPGSHKNFAVVDAAMNDLMRPALYDAYHAVLPVAPRGAAPLTYDVVGPVCESGDFLARARPLALREGDLLALLSAGAYGMSMSSNYNTRPRAAEVLVDGDAAHLVRAREDTAALFAAERLLP